MGEFFYLLVGYFFFLTVLSCVLSYMNFDPMKSSFFLIFSLLTGVPLISFFCCVWYSYFICLIFLSGIFVILVYFSSLSKFTYFKKPFCYIGGLITFLYFYPLVFYYFKGVTLVNFYYDVFWFIFIWIILVLILFMNFTSYFLNFSGALRKV